MVIKGIIGFFVSMFLFMPYSFAFSWQEDIDAATVDPLRTYEVYSGMTIQELHTTWSDVPGWHVETWAKQDEESNIGYSAIFQKDGMTPDKVRESFFVYYNTETNTVDRSDIHFFTTNQKTAHKILDYARKRINRLTKHAGLWDTMQTNGSEYTSAHWGGKWNGNPYIIDLTLLSSKIINGNETEYCVMILK